MESALHLRDILRRNKTITKLDAAANEFGIIGDDVVLSSSTH
jgi:hypothetical protein